MVTRTYSMILIEKVLYVPEMKCNLMRVGYLIKKRYSMIMKNEYLKLFEVQST